MAFTLFSCPSPTRDDTLMPSSRGLPKTQLCLDPCSQLLQQQRGCWQLGRAHLCCSCAVRWSTGSGDQVAGAVPLSGFPCSVQGSGEPRVQPSVQRASPRRLRLCPVTQSHAAACFHVLSMWLV